MWQSQNAWQLYYHDSQGFYYVCEGVTITELLPLIAMVPFKKTCYHNCFVTSHLDCNNIIIIHDSQGF